MNSALEFVRRDTCDNGNDYNGQMGARISAVFVILVTSSFGSFFPILSSRYSFVKMPWQAFFFVKYFGSGVIVATAFIHLLQPANENLSDECLGPAWQLYPYAFAICLVTMFVLFFFELMAFRFIDKATAEEEGGHTHSHFGDASLYVNKNTSDCSEDDHEQEEQQKKIPDHFAHAKVHQDLEQMNDTDEKAPEGTYSAQILATLVLEFGVVFHSVFVGLTLAVSGEEFKTLYVVIVFHQLFEGLGLGTRIASTVWPSDRKSTPWLLAAAYGFTTPVAIAIGLGVRKSYPPNSATALITNGVFDSISSGILIYTGLVELMAHEFLFSTEFKGPNGTKRMLYAYFIMVLGTGLMALLGRWA